MYRSKLEQLTAALLKRAKLNFTYESEKLIYYSPVRAGRCSKCGAGKVERKRHYLPDFVLDDGRIVEAKGILNASQRTKFIDIKKANPDRVIYFVFGADNKLTKNSKTRYSEWCKQHGFEYGIKALPKL